MADSAPVRVLFVCRQNRSRSATAERIFRKRPELDVRSAGTDLDALVHINAQMLDWAQLVFIMDDDQRTAMNQLFPEHPALERLVCLDIPDDYVFLDPDLVVLLEERVEPHLAAYWSNDRQ
jgi:predicted protein tyrosine phosphatase